jgi:two-component system response regulator HydG
MQEHAQLAGASGHSSLPRQGRSTRVLVVDDEQDACDAWRTVLVSDGYDATAETSAHAALARVARREFDLVVTDVAMAEMNGLELCRSIAEGAHPVPVILVTGRGEMSTVILALRAGAIDFLTKPVDGRTLSAAVARALTLRTKQSTLAPVHGQDRPETQPRLDVHLTQGQSAQMRQVYQLVADLSGSLASVLLEGESGTGKEVIAHAVHDSSQVRKGPFVVVNCAAMPAGLLESELFGHVRGAFTDAKRASQGLFVAANGGTLLLDEIGELPLEMQPKLLRALQQRTVRPVGGRDEVAFDCRLITATNRDLAREVKAKRFREDLYYRLDVVRLTVPPLRERSDDILALARHFLARSAKGGRRNMYLTPAVEQLLLAYRWPGNVRELENCIESAVAMARADGLTIEDLPKKVRFFEPSQASAPREVNGADVVSLNEAERRHILRAIELSGGNKTVAAKLLGINRRTLQRRIKYFAATSDVDTPSSPGQ